MVLLCNLNAIGHVADDVLCTLERGKVLVVLVESLSLESNRLVLNEAERIVHLSKVVVQRTGPKLIRVVIHCPGNGLDHIHHLKRMLEGTRGLLLQLAYKRIRSVAKLNKTRIGHKVEELLEKEDQRLTRYCEH